MLSQIASFPPATPAFSFAFQPIVDGKRRATVAYEAFVRGRQGESAAHVFFQVRETQMFRFDLQLRDEAIALASSLKMQSDLHLNFLAHGLDQIATTLDATMEKARQCRFPLERLVLEVNEGEFVENAQRFLQLLRPYREAGLRLAIDDFGSRHAALSMLIELKPDMIKLDTLVVRGIDTRPDAQHLARAVTRFCSDLNIAVIAEGVENDAESGWLMDAGISLLQGNLFAASEVENLPQPRFRGA